MSILTRFNPILLPSLAAVFAAVAVPLAPAAEGGGQHSPQELEAYQQRLFKQVDADGDGRITKKEFAVAVMYAEFKEYDANNNGKVTEKEFKKKSDDMDAWRDLDRDGNGSIKFEDVFKSERILKELDEEWAKLDKQRKGYITLADLPDMTP